MLEVDEYGAGPPLVLIHGSPANGKTWKAVGDLLSNRFRVIAPTLPDHEVNARPSPSPMRTEDMAQAVEQVIGERDRPIRLAAHSFGSNVALAIALGGRVAIDWLVLFEPVTMKILPVAGEDMAFAAAKSAFDSYVERFRRGEPWALETMIEFWFGPGGFDRMPAPVQDYLIERTEVNVRDVGANFGEQYSPEVLRDLQVPTTIVLGGASPAITGTIANAMASALGNASTKIIDGATHAMLVTHPENISAAIATPN
jgi:pimeloyl-ACP methyl ester carboxylesterase